MREDARSSPSLIFFVVALAIAAVPIALSVFYRVHPALGYVVGINLATLILYGYDKAVSGGEKLRVPERVLHVLALLGGSPAAFLGSRLFRHKTVKASFRRVYWLIVLLQAALVGVGLWLWLHPPAWLPVRG